MRNGACQNSGHEVVWIKKSGQVKGETQVSPDPLY